MRAASLLIIAEASQLVIGVVFLYSGFSKVTAARDFIRGVDDYRVLPERLVPPAGWIVILSELLVGVSHLSGLWMSTTSIAVLLLLASFAVAVSVNVGRGRRMPCHCRFTRSEVIGSATLTRIAALMLLEAIVIYAGNDLAGHSLFAHSATEVLHIAAVALLLFVLMEWCSRASEVKAVARRAWQGWRRDMLLRERR